MIRLRDIKIKEDLTNEQVFKKAISKYKIKPEEVEKWYVQRKSIDARKKEDIYYNIMQVGLYIYIGVLWYRLTFCNVWGKNLILYLKTNYIVLCILFLFLVFYSTYLIHKMNTK